MRHRFVSRVDPLFEGALTVTATDVDRARELFANCEGCHCPSCRRAQRLERSCRRCSIRRSSTRGSTAGRSRSRTPTGARGAGGTAHGGRKGAPNRRVAPGERVVLADIDGPGTVRHVWLTIPPSPPEVMRAQVLEVFYDGADEPSVSVPVLDFFCLPHGRAAPVASALVAVQEGRGFNSYLPMPFATSSAHRVHERVRPRDHAVLPTRSDARATARRVDRLPPRDCFAARTPP